MESPFESLPEDPERLKALLADQRQALCEKDHELSERDDALARSAHEIEILKSKLAWFEEQLRLARHKRFGASSEKHAYQGQLFNEAELVVDAPESEDEQEITYRRRAKSKPGRRPLPPDLPREECIHDLPEQEKVCGCCGEPLHCIGEERSEKLDVIPARPRVIVHVRPKYACRGCEEGVKTAPLPPQPIPKSIASAGLLAWLVISKYRAVSTDILHFHVRVLDNLAVRAGCWKRIRTYRKACFALIPRSRSGYDFLANPVYPDL